MTFRQEINLNLKSRDWQTFPSLLPSEWRINQLKFCTKPVSPAPLGVCLHYVKAQGRCGWMGCRRSTASSTSPLTGSIRMNLQSTSSANSTRMPKESWRSPRSRKESPMCSSNARLIIRTCSYGRTAIAPTFSLTGRGS